MTDFNFIVFTIAGITIVINKKIAFSCQTVSTLFYRDD